MKLSIGIVGLPNVGKSSLFNALLQRQIADSANYPFCTIEPNVGVVEVPDKRLNTLAKIVETKKIIYPAIEFYDIAGLVKGASKGEGLGNKFLSHIKEVSAIAHVIRLFEDKNIKHVSDKINPVEDLKTIEYELILKDLETLEKQKKPKGKITKEETIFFQGVDGIKNILNKGVPGHTAKLSEKELLVAKRLNLLSFKPVIYVLNVDEEQVSDPERFVYPKLKEVGIDKTNSVVINARLENELKDYPLKERLEFLQEFNIQNIGLDKLIQKGYSILGLISFLTAGKKEVKAWTIKKGTTARSAAGVIHTDFEKGFIKADVVRYDDFVKNNGWIKARENGLVSSVGEDYIMKDGDIVEFKFNV